MFELVFGFLMKWLFNRALGELYARLFGEYRWMAWLATISILPIIHAVRTRTIPPNFKLSITSDDRGFTLPLGISLVLVVTALTLGAGSFCFALALALVLLTIFAPQIDWQGFRYGLRATIFLAALFTLPFLLSNKFSLTVSQTMVCFWVVAFSFGSLLFVPLIVHRNSSSL